MTATDTVRGNASSEETDAEPDAVRGVLAASSFQSRTALSDREREWLRDQRARFMELAAGKPVYGLSRGYGPLVEYAADEDPERQADGLLAHLSAGQGEPLAPAAARTAVWLRLASMRHGYSGADPSIWDGLAAQWNAGFTPVIPGEGSLSASGDLIPLAHAAQAAAGRGEAYEQHDGQWIRRPAPAVLARLGLAPVTWEARTALAFVNGTSAALAVTLHAQARLRALTRAAAEATGRLAALLGASQQAYAPALALVRGHAGHAQAAGWIRAAAGPGRRRDPQRPLQEPYSLRCAPQVLGAILDQLRLQGELLGTEAAGCTDNPVLAGDSLLHGGNFHAAPVGLAAEQLTLCAHQLAYLAERQLALVVDPQHNGGRPPMLTPFPGRASGLAGVQIAASSLLASIRQHAHPASLTPVPSNLGNQDHVPMALNAANALSAILQRAAWIVASVYLAAHQLAQGGAATRPGPEASAIWRWMDATIAPLGEDRPLAGEVKILADQVERQFASPPGAPEEVRS